jgi:hypothetical protein
MKPGSKKKDKYVGNTNGENSARPTKATEPRQGGVQSKWISGWGVWVEWGFKYV